MAKEKSKDQKLKKLYNQLRRHEDQPVHRTVLREDEDENLIEINVLTRRGRIENKIQTLENTK